MINYSRKSNAAADDDNNKTGDGSGTGMLYTITRPIFQNTKSSLPSSIFFIANCGRARFFISARPIHLINQSLRGYIQFFEKWKGKSKPLDFLPLEQIDAYDHYLPEVIEEEIIISSASPSSPYYDNRRVVQRKIISGSAQSREETSGIVTHPPRSFDKGMLKANNIDERHHPLLPPPHSRQQSEMPSYQEARHKSPPLPRQKSIKKTIEVPKKDHASDDDDDNSPSGENKDKSRRLRVSEPKTYSEKVFMGSFNSNEKAAEDHSRPKSSDRPRLPLVMPSPLPLEGAQLREAENLNQLVSRSVEQNRSSETLDSLQEKHIDKTEDRAQIDKETIYEKKPSDDNFRIATHQQGIVRQLDDRELSSSSISESLNLLKHPETSSHDHPQSEETRNKLPEPVDLVAELASDADNNNNNNSSYVDYDKKNNTIPNIKVNRLEIHVVGNRRPPTYLPNGPMEIAESTNKLGRHDDDEEYAATTTTTSIKSLNKSYLWKYKVRLS